MSYTLTYDASHKVTRKGGHDVEWLRHIGRDLDERDGIKRVHRNSGIDPKRTHLNQTFVRDADGQVREARSVQELEDAYFARLSQVKMPKKKNGQPHDSMRKDAVTMRPLILQLDPEYFDEVSPDWRKYGLNVEGERAMLEMVKWAEDEFGVENVPFYSFHLDETSPQVQLGLLPITEDGRLAQKEVFKGPRQLKNQHNEFRQRMRDKGYDITDERVTSDRTLKSMGDAQYKRYRATLRQAEEDRQEATEALERARAAEARALRIEEQARQAQQQAQQQIQTLVDAVEASVDPRALSADAFVKAFDLTQNLERWQDNERKKLRQAAMRVSPTKYSAGAAPRSRPKSAGHDGPSLG